MHTDSRTMVMEVEIR